MQLETALTILLLWTYVSALPLHSHRSSKATPVEALNFFRHFDIVIHEFPPMPVLDSEDAEEQEAPPPPGVSSATPDWQQAGGAAGADQSHPLMVTFVAKSKNAPACPSKAEIMMYLMKAYGNIWEMLGRPMDWRMAMWVMRMVDLPNFACKNL